MHAKFWLAISRLLAALSRQREAALSRQREAALSRQREADVLHWSSMQPTPLLEFGICNILKHLGVWTCCPFRRTLAGAQGFEGAINF